MEEMKHKRVLNFLAFSNFFLFLVVSFLLFGEPVLLCAQEIPLDKKEVFSSSGFPIPRFVSLSKQVTNVRAGPGQQYPIKWVYRKKGLPVEIILEYDHWRKIRDYEGSIGWVYKTLLSGHRTAFVVGRDVVRAYNKNPSRYPKKARVVMVLEPLSLVHVKMCKNDVCFIKVSNLSGWIERKSLWGVYETENFD